MYDIEILTFHIIPEYDRHSWIYISNTRGAGWSLSSDTTHYSEILANLPYEKLAGVEGFIYAFKGMIEEAEGEFFLSLETNHGSHRYSSLR